MKKFTILLLLLFNAQLSIFNLQSSMVNVMANDGVYYTSGNFLVPLRETDIAVKKEVLEITLCRDSFATVTVDYTLYNNSEDKRVTMAFEAAAPYNAWVPINRQGSHPFIEDFTVLFNGEKLTYRNALVEAHTINSSAAEKGSRKDCLVPLDPNEWKGYGEVADSLLPMDDVLVNPALPDSFRTYAYAYYFDAPFRKGENRVRHTYRYRMSWGVGRDYELSYWLTPITRWRGGQVDDFTLRIKSETDREIIMNDSLFLGAPFKLEGIGDIYQLQSDYWGYSQCLFAPLMEGNVLEWHGTNFAPTENRHIEPLYLLKGGVRRGTGLRPRAQSRSKGGVSRGNKRTGIRLSEQRHPQGKRPSGTVDKGQSAVHLRQRRRAARRLSLPRVCLAQGTQRLLQMVVQGERQRQDGLHQRGDCQLGFNSTVNPQRKRG